MLAAANSKNSAKNHRSLDYQQYFTICSLPLTTGPTPIQVTRLGDGATDEHPTHHRLHQQPASSPHHQQIRWHAQPDAHWQATPPSDPVPLQAHCGAGQCSDAAAAQSQRRAGQQAARGSWCTSSTPSPTTTWWGRCK